MRAARRRTRWCGVPIADAAALAALLDDERIGAVAVGRGWAATTRARALLDAVLASPRDLVIDADALSLLGRDVGARIGADRRHVYLTPHSGEFDRLFGQSDANKIDRTVAAAAATGATILHKGADTVIAGPDGQVIVSASATPWLSTAGTGDVLAGLLASRHARVQDRDDDVRRARRCGCTPPPPAWPGRRSSPTTSSPVCRRRWRARHGV